MIAVVMVTFGRYELTKHTLDSLFKSKKYQTSIPITITVVDNGSQLKVKQLLLEYGDKIDNLVLLNNNRGKPYAWNLGARIAQERCLALKMGSGPEYFLFCDSDLEFKIGWDSHMLTAYRDHQHLPLCALSGLRWPSHKLDGLKTGDRTQVNVVRFPPGCCIMMSKEAFAANGNWDTKRLIRTVDTAYFRNAQNRGYVNASVYPTTVIDHTGRKHRSWHIQTGKPKLLP